MSLWKRLYLYSMEETNDFVLSSICEAAELVDGNGVFICRVEAWSRGSLHLNLVISSRQLNSKKIGNEKEGKHEPPPPKKKEKKKFIYDE